MVFMSPVNAIVHQQSSQDVRFSHSENFYGNTSESIAQFQPGVPEVCSSTAKHAAMH